MTGRWFILNFTNLMTFGVQVDLGRPHPTFRGASLNESWIHGTRARWHFTIVAMGYPGFKPIPKPITPSLTSTFLNPCRVSQTSVLLT